MCMIRTIIRSIIGCVLIGALQAFAVAEDEEDLRPWTAQAPVWTAEMQYVEGLFDEEPPNRVRLILQRSEDLRGWENTEIIEEWFDQGTIIQDSHADNMFYRLGIVTMDRSLVDNSLTVRIDGDAITGRVEVRTRSWQMITTYVREFAVIPVPWGGEVAESRHDEANTVKEEVILTMVKRLESGVFRAGDALEVSIDFLPQSQQETEQEEEHEE